MSDTIQTLNEIVSLCAGRSPDSDDANMGLLENVVEAAGDCLEEHLAASLRAKPRKHRVYRDVVEQIAVHFCDDVENDGQAYHACAEIRTILHNYNIVTRDFEGKEVKI